MERIIHGDGQRFAPVPGQEAPIAEQTARLQYLAERFDLNGKRVLDCGCGTGYSLPILASRFTAGWYVGIDMEKKALDLASRNYNDLKCAVMNGCCLAFPSRHFDVVLSFEVLEHLTKDQQEEYIKEIHRVMKHGGTMILSTLNKDVFSLGYANSLNLYHVGERTLSELGHLLRETFRSVEILGQYFHDAHLKRKDHLQIKSKFTLRKRLKRYVIRLINNNSTGKMAYDLYAVVKARLFGQPQVYPFGISASDFKFDDTHLDDSKWFFCVCQK